MLDMPKVVRYDATKFGYDKCRGAHIRILCAVLNEMDARITVKMFNSSGYIDKFGKLQGLTNDVLSGTVHMAMNSYTIKDFWKAQLYPYFDIEIKIISPNDSDKFADRILFILNLRFWLVFITSSFASVLILRWILKRSTSEASLEFVRMLVSSSTLTEPHNLYGKALLMIMVLITLAIGSFIQSQLTELNTVPYQTSIDSVEGLIQTDKPIYAVASYLNLMYPKALRERVCVIKTYEECVNRLKRGERIICVYGNSVLRYYLYESSRIHISKGNLLQIGATFTCAEDSPFINRMNWILSRLNEGGFINFLFKRDELYYARDPNIDDSAEALELKNVATTFHILVYGWTLAISVYLTEVAFYFIRKYITRN